MAEEEMLAKLKASREQGRHRDVDDVILSRKDNRVWIITIPDDIINERVTDYFRVILKKHFCKKYNGEQLVIRLGEDENAEQLGFVIDKEENTIEFEIKEKATESEDRIKQKGGTGQKAGPFCLCRKSQFDYTSELTKIYKITKITE